MSEAHLSAENQLNPAERLARVIYRAEADKCKSLDAAVAHMENWRRAIPEADAMLAAAGIYNDIATLKSRIASLERDNKVLQLKANNSLANNLCSDHFDKQVGKPCLACAIEKLERDAARLDAIAEHRFAVAFSDYIAQVIWKGRHVNLYHSPPKTGVAHVYPSRLDALRAAIDAALQEKQTP